MALLLDSLVVENFRGFRSLKIEKLGRVNLIVGKNSSGKSTILEALRLYASRGAGQVLWDLLLSREELTLPAEGKQLDLVRVTTAFLSLFHGRPTKWEGGHRLEISAKAREPVFVETSIVNASPVLLSGSPGMSQTSDLENDSRFPLHLEIASEVFIPPEGIRSVTAAAIWDGIALTEVEESVVEILRIVLPTVERISFIGDPKEKRVAVAKLREESRAIPIRSLGDGATRLLGLALALVSVKGGFVLVDEIENGLHFSIQRKLWEAIFKIAHRLDVQLLATTHSWDCIEAFQAAALDDKDEQGVLIRLDTRDGAVSPVVISEKDFEVIAERQIEVR